MEKERYKVGQRFALSSPWLHPFKRNRQISVFPLSSISDSPCQDFLAKENIKWKTNQIDPQEESKLLEYILDRDWIEPVQPLWDPKSSKKSCAFIVAARTGKSVKRQWPNESYFRTNSSYEGSAKCSDEYSVVKLAIVRTFPKIQTFPEGSTFYRTFSILPKCSGNFDVAMSTKVSLRPHGSTGAHCKSSGWHFLYTLSVHTFGKCDWIFGKILKVRLKNEYSARKRIFVQIRIFGNAVLPNIRIRTNPKNPVSFDHCETVCKVLRCQSSYIQ